MKSSAIFFGICVVHIKAFDLDTAFKPAFDKFPFEQRACECGKSSVSRIIGGTQAPKLKYPWMTALCRTSVRERNCRYENQFCGGSLISSVYVLTAAHCVENERKRNLLVSVGDWDLNEVSNVMERDVMKITSHADFDNPRGSLANDIALLLLSKPFVFSDDVRPICLPIQMNPNPTYADATATVIGWGSTDPNSGVYPPILREVDVKVLANAACDTQYGGNGNGNVIINSMICAALPDKDSCYGDSGGPMAVKNSQTNRYEQIGIVSFGNGCAQPNFAGVYTRVTSFLPWIKDNMGGTIPCTS